MKKQIQFGLIGSSGRLGSEVNNLFSENGHELVYKLDKEGEWKNNKPEVLIDCSLPEVFETTMKYVNDFNIPLITAVTGLSEKQVSALKKLSEKVPVVQSYNFSTGIQVLLKLTETASEVLTDWDIEISETHHRFKLDKPSGTAQMLASKIKQKQVPVLSFRHGNIPGNHTIYFGGLGEVLSLTHSVTSRRTFAEGILKSAEFILTKNKGFYSFTDVVFPEVLEGT